MRLRSALIVAVLAAGVHGCGQMGTTGNTRSEHDTAPERGRWLEMPREAGGGTFELDPGGLGLRVPRRLVLKEVRAYPHRFLGGHLALGDRSLAAAAIGEVSLSGQSWVVVQFETGSGVTNPVLCLYVRQGDATDLRYVWSRPLFSVHGFATCAVAGKSLRLTEEFPGEASGRREHRGSTDLPLPEGLEP